MTSTTARALLALTATSLLAACTPAGSDPGAGGPPVLDEAGILAEYAAETTRLELAPGGQWDDRPWELTGRSPDPDRPILYEAGVGAQTAQFRWYCSWAETALTGKRARARALDELAAFPDLSVWAAMDDTGHAIFTRIMDEAGRGDLGELDEYVRSNCDHPSAGTDE